MKVLVYGAGPQGSYIAYQLKDSGVDVTVLAKGKRLEYIEKYGILLEPINSDKRTSRKVETMERLFPEDAFDLVIVSVGKHHYSGVRPYLAANIMTPNILFVGNNAAGIGEQARLLGGERILLGYLDLCGNMQGRIVKYRERENHTITLGEPDGSESARLGTIKELLTAATFTVNISPDMEAMLKHHAALIVPISAAFQQAEGDLEALNRDDRGLNLMMNTIRETVTVLKGMGHTDIPESIKRLEWVPQQLQTMYARRLVTNQEFEYIYLNGDALKPEIMILSEELAELMRESETPFFDPERKRTP